MHFISSIPPKNRAGNRKTSAFKRNVFAVLAIFLFISASVYAQSKTDSIKAALQNALGVNRAELLLKLSGQTRQSNIEKAIAQAEEALNIAKRRGVEELKSESLATLAWYYSMVDRDTVAVEYYLKALNLERQHGHRLAEASILHRMGRFYHYQNNETKALNYFFQSLRIREKKGEKKQAANTLKYIGYVYVDRNKSKQALPFFKKAYRLQEQFKDYKGIAFTGAALGNAFQTLGKYEEAIAYYKKALEAAKQIQSIHAHAGILLSMSSIYKEQKLFKKAVALNNKQLQIANAHKSKILKQQGFTNLAGLNQVQGNIERSNEYLKKAILLNAAMGLTSAIELKMLAQNYIQQQRYTKAVAAAERGLEQAQKEGLIQKEENLLEILVQAYRKQGAFQKALQAQNKLIAVNKQIYNQEKAKQIAQMQTRYETEQKEQQIALLQKKQENAALWRKVLIIGLILIVVIGFLIYKRQRLKIKKNKTDLENVRLKEQQLKQDVEFKNKQLTTHSLNLVQKNEIMKELKQNITDIQNNSNGKSHRKLRDLQYMVDYSFNLDKDWEDFKYYFEEVHTGFFKALKARSPDLTTNELRLSALVKLNLTVKEVAAIMNISPNSVKTARYRLRKRLGMKTEENLTDFMLNIEKETAEK